MPTLGGEFLNGYRYDHEITKLTVNGHECNGTRFCTRWKVRDALFNDSDSEYPLQTYCKADILPLGETDADGTNPQVVIVPYAYVHSCGM